jgi:hypothetical protein
VICDGELLVSKSADAACDAARALKAKGITGNLIMLDGKTGKPRYTVSIEKAAGLTVEEGPCAPRFRKYRARGGSEARSAEMASDGLADQETGEAA